MIKRLRKGILGTILLAGTSCYQLPELNLPHQYQRENTPYYTCAIENKNLSIHTPKKTRYLVDEANEEIPRLIKLVETFEGQRLKHIPLEILILSNRDFDRVLKNKSPRFCSLLGCYLPKERYIVLRDIWDGFKADEKRTFIHEYLHFLDLQDKVNDLTEDEVTEKAWKLWEMLENKK